MPYIRSRDYDKQIQADNLSQIITSDSALRLQAELAAQAEVVSYLTQKYDVAQEFTDTVVFSMTTTYKVGDRIYLDFPVYVQATSYIINDLAAQDGKQYVCIAPTTGTFNPVKWKLLGNQFDLFFVTIPQPLFSLEKGIYKIGDQVFWKNRIYTNKIPTPILDQDTLLQFGTISNVPFVNVFPDDILVGIINWGSGTSYTLTAGTLPTDTTKWTFGDNRSQQILMYMIDMVLYHLHSRIAPRNIPQLRMDRYDMSIAWLKNAAKGTDITAAIPKLQPTQGRRIRFGGNIKNVNSY